MPRGRKPERPCGTAAAARRHYKHGELLDEACKAAVRRQSAESNARRGTGPGDAGSKTADSREVRNGLPEFRPYVYRGTGYDIMPGAADGLA
jgi:hypothetical protein